MLRVPERPTFTTAYDSLDDFRPVPGSTYLYGESAEDRSVHGPDWEHGCDDVEFIRVIEVPGGNVEFARSSGSPVTAPLRAAQRLRLVMDSFREGRCYLDITGMAHHVWAPLLRAILGTGRIVDCVYVEPISYRRAAAPTDSDIFDLSERIEGIAPIQGFASLSRDDAEFVLVPLLGFEGTRFQFVLEQIEPGVGRTVPVIGAPGFRPEYTYVTYLSNRNALLDTRSWEQVRYARANCPFSLMWTLEDVSVAWPSRVIRVAAIGTKPHALGAVLFYLYSSRRVELIYDHPIRKRGRTSGSSRALVYNVSRLPFQPDKLKPESLAATATIGP